MSRWMGIIRSQIAEQLFSIAKSRMNTNVQMWKFPVVSFVWQLKLFWPNEFIFHTSSRTATFIIASEESQNGIHQISKRSHPKKNISKHFVGDSHSRRVAMPATSSNNENQTRMSTWTRLPNMSGLNIPSFNVCASDFSLGLTNNCSSTYDWENHKSTQKTNQEYAIKYFL